MVCVVKDVGDDGLSGHTMLDGREGDEYHPSFYLDQWSTPLVFSCLFDELPNDEAQAGVDTDQAPAVLRPSAVRIEEIIEHIRFIHSLTPSREHIGVIPGLISTYSLLSSTLTASESGTVAASSMFVPAWTAC